MFRWDKRKSKNTLLFLIAVFLLVIPFLYTMYYSLPSTDDFWMAAGIDKNNVFSDAIATANTFYLNWGGGWLYIFLEVLLNPLVYFGINGHYLGIELIFFLLVFLCVLYSVIKTCVQKILKITDSRYIMAIYFLILVLFLNTTVYTEIFYWFVGSSYLWSMILILYTVKLEINFFTEETHSWGKILLMSVVGFCACMCYTEAIFPGAIFLIFFFYEVKQKKWKMWHLIPFISWVAGGVIAVVAPGNYMRYDETSLAGNFSLFGAIKNSAVMTMNGIFDLLKNPVFIIVAVCFVAIGIYKGNQKIENIHPAISFIITIIGLWITYFPFALGYGSYMYIPNRCQFIFNLYAVLSFAVCFFYLGCWLKEKESLILNRKQLQMVAIGLVIFGYICLIPTKYYQELPYAQTVAQSHQVKLAYSEWNYLLNYIATSDGDEIVFDRNTVNTPIIKSPGITSDADHSINQHIASYFGKESVAINWQ